jgi:hypothetical protein
LVPQAALNLDVLVVNLGDRDLDLRFWLSRLGGFGGLLLFRDFISEMPEDLDEKHLGDDAPEVVEDA